MNEYQKKIEEKRERFATLAVKKQAESDTRWEASNKMASFIPFGQPILVGHHSERGHRAALAKIESNRNKSIELEKTAKYYEKKAEEYGTHGISSDNPEAVKLLEEKLAGLKRAHAMMKEQSKKLRAAGQQVPSFHLANSNASIRRVEQRIELLKKEQETTATEPISGCGWSMHENLEDNRIHFVFPGKPSEETRSLLKSRGFKWSPTRGAWVRQLNENSRLASKQIAKLLATVV